MEVRIDVDGQRIEILDGDARRELPLYSDESFACLSRIWTKVGWSLKHQYGFSWLGRPIIQLPEDLIRVQEVVHRLRPDVIIETGVAHGGSLIYYATLCHAMDHGRVIGVDIEIRPHNRAAITEHPLAGYVTLIEGSSVEPTIVDAVRGLIAPGESVLVVLDSNHTRGHVAGELEAYSPFVTEGSYIVVTDGLMSDLHDVPRGAPAWATDNPTAAAEAFLADHPEFVLDDDPHFRDFDESLTKVVVTHWPRAYLRRVKDN